MPIKKDKACRWRCVVKRCNEINLSCIRRQEHKMISSELSHHQRLCFLENVHVTNSRKRYNKQTFRQLNYTVLSFSLHDEETAYQVLQLLWITAPGWCTFPPCMQGHISMGTHWPRWSCISPDGHWQPGTQVLRPVPVIASSQFNPSEHESPQARPHSW